MSESDQRARRNPLSTSLERIGIVAFGGIALAVVLVIAAIFVSARLGKPAQQLQTEILVGASPSRVWEVATALDDYASWNPYMRNVDGFVRPHATITLLLELPGDRVDVTAVVDDVIKNREFRWRSQLYALPGVSTLEYTFRVEPLGNGSARVVQTLNLRGLLLYYQGDAAELLRGLERMAKALKQRAETPEDP